MQHFRPASLLAAAAMLIALSACAYDDGYYDNGYGGGPAYAGADVDVYYDGFYGPYHGGYWGPSGVYYYDTDGRHHYRRAEGDHFRRHEHQGYHRYRGGPPPHGDRDRDRHDRDSNRDYNHGR